MKITNLLQIIAMSKDFEIIEDECYFTVKHLKSNSVARISKNYNGMDWADIEPSAFDELRESKSEVEQ